jgi:hypothetical protein
MKIYPLLFILLLGRMSAYAQQAITDGPYIWYKGKQVTVKAVKEKTADRYVADSSKISIAQAKNKTFKVHLDKHPEWDFTVRLKQNISSPASVTSGNAEKTLLLSDIEGEFEPFRDLLLSAKVINEKYNWIFGQGKLVVAGDLFDRGKQVCQFLWLLYKLEDEAAAKGGEVHVILGNHDIMNLSGDYRYVQQEYGENAYLMKEHYHDFYSKDSELGRWLRSKNTIEKIGDLLVMHGGMSQTILNLKKPLDWINTNCHPYYDVKSEIIPAELKPFFSGEDALFWYRGYFKDPKATVGQVDSTLAFYGAKKIIVGHDIINHVDTLYSGKVIGVDVDEHNGVHEALLIEKGKYYRIDDKGNKQELIKY